MTEAVGYISGRFEVLSTTVFLGALIAARQWLIGAPVWALPTFLFWTAALASKETAIVLPVVVAALDYLIPDRRSRLGAKQRFWRVHLPLALFAAVVGVARLVFLTSVEYADQTAIQWRYLTIVLDVIRRYLWLLINPAAQTAFHEVSLPQLLSRAVLMALTVIAAAGVFIWRCRAEEPRASLGVIWFFAALLPSSMLILLDRGEPMAEHRVYLASCGLFIAVGAGAERLWDWAQDRRRFRPWLVAAAALVLMSFGLETILRNQLWASPVELWREAVIRAPAHPRPRLLLGEALHDAGRRDEAIVQFERALALRPDDAIAHLKLGQTLAEVGRFDAARRHLQRALQLTPDDPGARHSLDVLDKLAGEAGH
jgi:tetratricopeptide (TPR) repeat protein